MMMLGGKALALFCVIFMYPNHFLIKAQPAYPFHVCRNHTTYAPDSEYSRNLGAVLESLQPTSYLVYDYLNSSSGEGIHRANAIFLCRGDVEQNMCVGCLRDSKLVLRFLCPNETEAVIYYEFCLLKYSNAPILGNNDMMKDLYYGYNFNNATNKEQFDGILLPFMNKLRGEAAAGGSLLKFAMDETSALNSTTLYGLAQCLPSLPQQECDECLQFAIDQFPTCCNGKIGGLVLMARCNLRYELYEFYINPRDTRSPSLPVPSPPGKKTSRSRTVIFVIIPTVIAILIASICIFIILRRKKNLAKKGETKFLRGVLISYLHKLWW